ncbi:hypothetical protein F2P81_022306 [Scophthalmus maximus]|uniref:Glycylpeptide N-tetradecanoyltransferase n=1 Tax=Scophthalmus maximus TaxID=52904 RepID=A0A6A4RZI4_SCOMX|nr:hypothetical protein F2P81_022306 [Scophthalmus maximus]
MNIREAVQWCRKPLRAERNENVALFLLDSKLGFLQCSSFRRFSMRAELSPKQTDQQFGHIVQVLSKQTQPANIRPCSVSAPIGFTDIVSRDSDANDSNFSKGCVVFDLKDCCSVLKQKNGLTKVTEVCSSAGARQKKSVAVVWQTVVVKAQSILSDSSQPPAPRVSDLAFRFSRVKYPKAKAKTYGHSFSPSESSPLNSDRIRLNLGCDLNAKPFYNLNLCLSPLNSDDARYKYTQFQRTAQLDSVFWEMMSIEKANEQLDSLPEKKQQEIQRALHLFSPGPSLPRTLQQAESHAYRFWDTQPVPRLGDKTAAHGPIAEGEVSVREEPYSLPQGFSWDTPDLSSPTVLNELRALLNENYRGEDDNTIRRDFSPEYLQWALQPPNWQAQWHCAVRVDTNNKLVGFIAAVPADVCAYETQQRMAQVKLLCVHKKLRLKRMTPVLIRELTRRVSRQGVRQAVYAAGVVLPTPLSSCRYWHRPLNPRKLMEVNYPGLRQNMNLQRALKFNRLPAGDGGALTDVVSFYSVSSRVLNHPVHADLRAAHLLHMASSATDLADLMEDTVVLAKSKGFDVFSALDVMDNRSFLDKLKFSVSDSSLHYYLYNWMCPSMSPDKVGLVLPN